MLKSGCAAKNVGLTSTRCDDNINADGISAEGFPLVLLVDELQGISHNLNGVRMTRKGTFGLSTFFSN